MDNLSLKVFPLAVGMISAMVMGALSLVYGTAGSSCITPFWLRLILGMLFFLAALLLFISSIKPYRANKTTWHSLHPEKTTVLIVDGVYMYSRNPMYVALILLLIGWGCWLGNIYAFLPLPLCIYYLTRFQIIPEERSLERTFGDEYRAYRKKTYRWL